MPRALLFPLSMMLLIAAAIAMLASAILLPMSDAAEFPVAGGLDVVERFYAAVNETIATGNPDALWRVVNPSFTDENPLPGVNPGRAGLEAYLVSLHRSDPGLRLEAEVISAVANQVVTRVQVRHESAPAGLSAVGKSHAIWSPIEVFHVVDGVIAERWGHTNGLTFICELAAPSLDLPSPTPRVVSLMRVTLEPGARWDAPRIAGPRLLFLEAGVLDVQAGPGLAGAAGDAGPGARASDGDHADESQRVMLAAGKVWQAPAGAITNMTSAGSAAAHLLVVTFSEPQIPNGDLLENDVRSFPSGVRAQVLAGDLATNLRTGSVTATLEQFTFAPGGSLNLWSTDGPILIAVETGQLEAKALGTAWVRRHRDGMSVTSRSGILTKENSMLLQPGGMVALRNAEQGPVQVLVVTIQRMDTGLGP